VAFASTEELYKAVHEYLNLTKIDATTPSNESRVALKYGYSIGTWNVSLLTDFPRVFDPNRTADLADEDRIPSTSTSPFNEDLSGWNVCHVIHRKGLERWNTSSMLEIWSMFFRGSSFNGNLSI
jgi:Mycoplasma protein of unknown function, DUF285